MLGEDQAEARRAQAAGQSLTPLARAFRGAVGGVGRGEEKGQVRELDVVFFVLFFVCCCLALAICFQSGSGNRPFSGVLDFETRSQSVWLEGPEGKPKRDQTKTTHLLWGRF